MRPNKIAGKIVNGLLIATLLWGIYVAYLSWQTYQSIIGV